MEKKNTNNKNKSNKSLKMTILGYDPKIVEDSTKSLIEQLRNLNFNFIGPTPLPTKRKVVTLLISPHKHHAAQEQFCRSIHRRTLWLLGDLTSREIDSLSKIKLSNQAKLNLKFAL